MVEGWGDNFDQKSYINALEFGAHEAFNVVKKIRANRIENKASASSKSANGINTALIESTPASSQIKDKANFVLMKFQESGFTKVYDILTDSTHDKQSRDDAISQVKNSIINSLLKNEFKSDPIAYNYNYLSELFTSVCAFLQFCDI